MRKGYVEVVVVCVEDVWTLHWLIVYKFNFGILKDWEDNGRAEGKIKKCIYCFKFIGKMNDFSIIKLYVSEYSLIRLAIY